MPDLFQATPEMAIESPWTVDKKGFVHQDTGERCIAEMRGPDKALPAAFRNGDDPERPTLTDEIVESIAGHKSVVRVRAAKDLTGVDALRTLVAFGDGLVDAGATALWCPETGASRSAQGWKDIAETIEVGSKKERMRGLFTAFVRPLVRRLFTKPQLLPPQVRQVRDDGWLLSGLEHGAVVRILGPYIVSGGWWQHELHREYHFAELRRGDCLWVFYDRNRRRWFCQGSVE